MSQFSRTLSRVAALTVLAALLACTQPSANPQADQETTAMRPAPTQEDEQAAKAAADAAAAAADAAAGSTEAGPATEEKDAQLPPGPSLSADDLVSRVARLVETLKSAADTEPAQVAKALDLKLAPDTAARRVGLTGTLASGGNYAIAVWPLYREEAPGQHVDVMLFPATWKGDPREPKNKISECTTPFEPFREKMAALGYQASEPEMYRPGQWKFFKAIGGTGFYVDAQVYQADDGSESGRGCIMSLGVDAANMDDVHG